MSENLYPEPDGSETGGWSGSDSSRERAVRDEQSGRAQHRREQAWEIVRLGGLHGATWKEVATALNCHHGSASGALSNLHKIGKVERLKDRRGGAAIYVLPHAVNGRETARFGRSRPPAEMTKQEFEDALAKANGEGWQVGYDQGAAGAAEEAYRAGYAAAQKAFDETAKRVRQTGRRQVATEFSNLAIAMQEQMNKPMHMHNSQCWQQYPFCTLTSVRRAADRILKETTDAG